MPQRFRIDTVLCLFTSTRTLMDGHYMGKFDPDSHYHDVSFEAGVCLLNLSANAR